MNEIRFVRRQLLMAGVAAGGLGLTPLAALAQGKYPSRPVRFIVPVSPGGAVDTIARTLGEAVARRLGQPVVVENKVGASGMLATDYVAKAPADGYTLTLSLSTALLINQFLYDKMPYNPQKDLLLLSQVSAAAVVLVVHPSVPATDMRSLLAWCKANKGKVSYGSWGVGSYAHLGGTYMSKTLDADMTHVAYKGEAPMMQDLLGGQLQFCFTSALNAKPFLDAGRIKAIGVTGNARMPVLPHVPTIHEQGVTDPAYLVTGWIAMAAPAGLPKDVVDTFSAALQEAARDPAVQDRLTGAGFVPVFSNPADFAKTYVADMAVWKNLVEMAGAKLD